MSLNETEVQWNLRLPLWVKQAIEIHAVKENETIKDSMKHTAEIYQIMDAESVDTKYNLLVKYIKDDWLKEYKEDGYSQTQQEELINLHIQLIKQQYPHLLQELENHVS